MACEFEEFPVAVKAKLMLTAIHCLLYCTSVRSLIRFEVVGYDIWTKYLSVMRT